MANFEKLLDIADDVAIKSQCRYRFGALVVRRSNILGVGCSRMSGNIPKGVYATHPRAAKWGAIHAEVAAIKNALLSGYDIQGAIVVVSGFTEGGNRTISCRPCGGCIRTLKEKKLQRVVFRTEDGYSVANVREMDENEVTCPSCDQTITGWSRVFHEGHGHH